MPRKEIEQAIQLGMMKAVELFSERISEQQDRLFDGAQASILSANILHGNVELGLPGFVPTMTANMEKLDGRVSFLEKEIADIKKVDKERWDKMNEPTFWERCFSHVRPMIKVLVDWKSVTAGGLLWLAHYVPIQSVGKVFSWLSVHIGPRHH